MRHVVFFSFCLFFFFFFFKQKTAYEMRISDWSSDVCSSDLISFKTLSRKEQQKAHQEGLVLSKLQHPNIVGYWENFVVKTRADTMLCIVMEYADGGDLENYLKKRFGRLLQESQVLDWFVQICLAVKHVHDRSEEHTSELQSLMPSS